MNASASPCRQTLHRIAMQLRAARDFILTAVVVFMAIVTLMAAYGGYFNPDTLPAAALLAMTFPLMIVADVIMAVVLLFVRRPLVLVFLATFVGVLPALNVYSPFHFNRSIPPGREAQSFTVLTYNALSWTDYSGEKRDTITPNATLQLILDANPDIICLQECGFAHASEWLGITDSMVEVMRSRYPYVARSPYSPESLYSRFPIVKQLYAALLSPTASYTGYRLNVRGRLLTLINVHLQSIGLSNDDKALYHSLTDSEVTADSMSEVRSRIFTKLYAAFQARKEQSDSLRAIVSATNSNVIICGDFNDVPGCYAIRNLLDAGMRDAYAEAGIGPGISYHAGRMYFRIDQILYRGDMTAVKTRRLRGGLSDHYPVMATFLWNSPTVVELNPDSVYNSI